MKQTAVLWLIDQLNLKEWIKEDGLPFHLKILDEAISLEKQQIIKTGLDCGSFIETEDMEQYYTSTYGSKGSDATSSQTEHNSPKVENKTSFGEISSQTLKEKE